MAAAVSNRTLGLDWLGDATSGLLDNSAASISSSRYHFSPLLAPDGNELPKCNMLSPLPVKDEELPLRGTWACLSLGERDVDLGLGDEMLMAEFEAAWTEMGTRRSNSILSADELTNLPWFRRVADAKRLPIPTVETNPLPCEPRASGSVKPWEIRFDLVPPISGRVESASFLAADAVSESSQSKHIDHTAVNSNSSLISGFDPQVPQARSAKKLQDPLLRKSNSFANSSSSVSIFPPLCRSGSTTELTNLRNAGVMKK